MDVSGQSLPMRLFADFVATLMLSVGLFPVAGRAAEVIEYFSYEDCILLSNSTTRVVLCPAAGGRVLEYSLHGKNALFLDPNEKGWVYASGHHGDMSAGRFDIGPEMIIPRHPQLWMGRWKGEITGANSARLTSVKDEATGVQLTRDFALNAEAELVCKQSITNISNETKQWCHWSRTFALGNGVCVIPLSKTTRFPKHYVMYGPGPVINFRPEDPAIRRVGEFLIVSRVPQQPKLGMDSKIGWFAYLMQNDLMLVKSFPTYPDRVYNEVAGLTISIWYPQDRRVELEPIGPRERLKPGESGSFTETWKLKDYPFPTDVKNMDPKDIAVAAGKTSLPTEP